MILKNFYAFGRFFYIFYLLDIKFLFCYAFPTFVGGIDLQEKILNLIENDREKIVNFCAELVRCDTSSSHGDTRSAAKFIKNFFDEEKIYYQEISACKTMPNLISSTEMKKKGKHLMLNGHLDVMPAGNEPGWLVKPFSGIIQDGKIIGRGTSDMKAGVTAIIFA